MREKVAILVAEACGFPRRAAEVLQEIGNLTLADLDRQGLLAAVAPAEVLWVRLRHRIDKEVMDRAPKLMFIVSPTTGLNHIDLQEADGRGVRVVSLRGEGEFLKDIRATAELTVMLALALMRRLPPAANHVLNGGWNRDLFKGHELYGKTVGIIGYGRLGQIVARYFQAFDCHVLASDPKFPARHVDGGVTLLSLTELLRRSDIVTLHADANPRTHGLFGRAEFLSLKPGTWLINTARGELVDEDALLDSLRSGRLAGAALDVVCDELAVNIKDHPLVSYAKEHDNLIVTPHIGGCTVESTEKTETYLADKLRRYLAATGSEA